MMRVTFLTTQLEMVSGGGSNPDRDARARAMKELGCDVKFITVFSQYNKFAGPFPAKVYKEFLHPKKMRFFEFHKAIRDIMRKYELETDIYFVDGHVFLLGSAWYRIKKRKPTVAYFEAYSFPTGTFKSPSLLKSLRYIVFKWLDKLYVSPLANNLDAFLAVSPVTRDIFVSRGLNKDKFHLLPNAMDYSSVKDGKGTFQCRNPKKFHILYSARITDDKGVDIALKAMKYLSDLDIGLDIGGDGPMRKGYMQLAQKLKLNDVVFWHGWVDRKILGSVFKHADVFIYPAKRAEALGTASLDSLACGTPAIVSSDTGMVWGVGEGGLVFKNGDPKDLADKIRMIYNNPQLRKSLSGKGLKRAENFDYRKVSRDLLAILENIIKKAQVEIA